ncbi:pyridoxal kinase PdxY [Deinococcus maricopensis]|uniref:pyridoxal kinase n=1 Tax=Deinococcus maricopensis (strain DSM 21211 / LMG 22137 / NRRL B-23946 / LB-34) TaxID=709986 RepID=E8U4F3_DEIML|nr:pyridoxal kinase PdxY [Deinococcus maricopensis]ADV68818.1 pyridoxal kinase [Deinococcus maricopensis DSM 21211]
MNDQAPGILSIQSWVSYGHVGNAAAMFPLQRLGFDVAAIHTVQFSNHTGYGAWRGNVFPPENVADLVEGIAERGALGSMHAVLSGYMGTAETVDAVLGAVDRVRAVRPDALYCCDPVMGDVGRGVFVRPEIPDALRERAIRAADIVTPNQFELNLLTGADVHTLTDALSAADTLRAQLRAGGPRIVIVTSLVRADAAPDTIETLAVTDAGAWLCTTPLLPLDPPRNGTGDAIAALFLGHYLRTHDAGLSLSLATSALYALLDRTHTAGTREIQLISAQDEYLQPRQVFPATQVR